MNPFRNLTRPWIAFLLAVVLMAAWGRAASLLVEGDNDGALWLTQVVKDQAAEGEAQVAVVRYRGPADREWAEVGRLDGRVLDTAVAGSQLAVLRDSGEWVLMWPGGMISGVPLPGGTPIKAIGSDGQTLWAVGIVSGALKPTTRRSATAPATTRAADVEAPRPMFDVNSVVDPRVILFRLDRDTWTPIARLDAALDARFAITGHRGEPVIAAHNSAGTLRLYTPSRHLGDVTVGSADHFALLPHEGSTLIWTAASKGPGDILRYGRNDPAVPLTVAEKSPPVESDRAVAIAAGRLRLLYLVRDKDADAATHARVYEQTYDLSSFKPVDTAVAQKFPVVAVNLRVQMILNAVMMAGMVIAMVISYQQRKAVRELLEKEDRPEPAPLLRRAAAGLIDLLVLLGCAISAFLLFRDHPNPLLSMEVAWAAGPIGYLLYTTLTELLLGKTLGKMILRLKVVGLDGAAPTRGMVIRRNLLRITDLPPSPMLLLVVLSPLRQRVGDIAAGTLVVVDEKVPGDKGPGDKAVGDNGVSEKAVSEKGVGEKAVDEKSVGGKSDAE